MEVLSRSTNVPVTTSITILPSSTIPIQAEEIPALGSKSLQRRHSFHASPPLVSPSTLTPSLDNSEGKNIMEGEMEVKTEEGIVVGVVENVELIETGSNEMVDDEFVGLYRDSERANNVMIPYEERRLGKCKFFSAQKGFGFIVDDRSEELEGSEVFVHYSAIDSSCNAGRGFRSLAEGEEVEYNLIFGNKGYQAHSVTGPNSTPVLGAPPMTSIRIPFNPLSNSTSSEILQSGGIGRKFPNRYSTYTTYQQQQSQQSSDTPALPWNSELASQSLPQENYVQPNNNIDSGYFGSPLGTPEASTIPIPTITTNSELPKSQLSLSNYQSSPYFYNNGVSNGPLSPPNSASPPVTIIGNESTVGGAVEYPFYPQPQLQPNQRGNQVPYPHPQSAGNYISHHQQQQHQQQQHPTYIQHQQQYSHPSQYSQRGFNRNNSNYARRNNQSAYNPQYQHHNQYQNHYHQQQQHSGNQYYSQQSQYSQSQPQGSVGVGGSYQYYPSPPLSSYSSNIYSNNYQLQQNQQQHAQQMQGNYQEEQQQSFELGIMMSGLELESGEGGGGRFGKEDDVGEM